MDIVLVIAFLLGIHLKAEVRDVKYRFAKKNVIQYSVHQNPRNMAGGMKSVK